MTLTKTLMFSSAAAAFLMAGSGGAWAQCNLPNDNWQCQTNTSTDTTTRYERAGNSDRCKAYDTTVTTTTFTAINPGGNVNEDKSGTPVVVTGEEERQQGTVTCPG